MLCVYRCARADVCYSYTLFPLFAASPTNQPTNQRAIEIYALCVLPLRYFPPIIRRQAFSQTIARNWTGPVSGSSIRPFPSVGLRFRGGFGWFAFASPFSCIYRFYLAGLLLPLPFSYSLAKNIPHSTPCHTWTPTVHFLDDCEQ